MTRNQSLLNALAIVHLGLSLVAITGCSESNHPQFRLNMEGRNFKAILATPEASQAEMQCQQSLVNLLTAAFGTPDQPFVFPESGLDLQKIKRAAGPAYSDQAGYQYGLYRKQCAHCHGMTGEWRRTDGCISESLPARLSPGSVQVHFYRPGIKPTRADLKRTLVEGLMGTAMPSFRLLPDRDIESSIEYVKYLSIRGQTEIELNHLIDRKKTCRQTMLVWPRLFLGWRSSGRPPRMRSSYQHRRTCHLLIPLDEPAWLASVDRGRRIVSRWQDGQLHQMSRTQRLWVTAAGNARSTTGTRAEAERHHAHEMHWQCCRSQQTSLPRNLRLGIYRGWPAAGRHVPPHLRRHQRHAHAGRRATVPQRQPARSGTSSNYVLSLPYEDERQASRAKRRLGRDSRTVSVTKQDPRSPVAGESREIEQPSESKVATVGKFWSLLFLLVPDLGRGRALCWLPARLLAAARHFRAWPPDRPLVHFHPGPDRAWCSLPPKWCCSGSCGVTTPRATREPVKYTHGSHNLEVIWTILPAATLLFIAIYQMNAWADVKMRMPEHAADGRSHRAAVRVASALSRPGRQARHAGRHLSRERPAHPGRTRRSC